MTASGAPTAPPGAALPRWPFADRIRAVLFDAGNTLLWIDHARMADIATAAGVPCDTDTLRAAEMRARPVLDPYLRSAVRRESRETAQRYAVGVLSELGCAAGSSAGRAAADALLAAWGTLWVVPPADAAPVLDGLRARGLRVGCVSNAQGSVATLLDRAGLLRRLSRVVGAEDVPEEPGIVAPRARHPRCVVDSGIEGVEKPDPRIFRLGCERLGSEPGETVYVGDFLSLDADGARAAGLEAVLLDPIGAWGDRGVPRASSLSEFAARL